MASTQKPSPIPASWSRCILRSPSSRRFSTSRSAADRGYKVQMTGEGGRLDLNWLFSPPQTPDPGKLAIFQRYLQNRGLNIQQQHT